MLKINEFFYSIQGESSYAGQPTLFIRTSGCHLRCQYCDTTYAYHEGQKFSLEDVLAKVQSYNPRFVCVTGGEPLLQPEVEALLKGLCDAGYAVSLETSGDLSCLKVDERVLKVIDVKTPDSAEFGKFHADNLLLRKNTEFKFVICSERDFQWAEQFANENQLFENFNVLYSPSFTQIDPKTLAEWILREKSRARLQLQLHKYIWSSQTRGV